MENFFRVSSSSKPTAVAGAIAKSIRDGRSVLIQAIGAGSINQAVKSIAVARGYLAAEQMDIVSAPSFIDLDIDVLVKPDFSYRVLDLDDFEANASRYGYSAEVQETAHAALAELIRLIETRSFPFDDARERA